jgi:hypothetical protein
MLYCAVNDFFLAIDGTTAYFSFTWFVYLSQRLCIYIHKHICVAVKYEMGGIRILPPPPPLEFN